MSDLKKWLSDGSLLSIYFPLSRKKRWKTDFVQKMRQLSFLNYTSVYVGQISMEAKSNSIFFPWFYQSDDIMKTNLIFFFWYAVPSEWIDFLCTF